MIKENNMQFILLLLVSFIAGGAVYAVGQNLLSNNVKKNNLVPFHSNIVNETENNHNYRKVLFTGVRSQLVVMEIPPDGEVGAETHKYTEQTLFFLSGVGTAYLNGVASPIVAGDVVVVTPGTLHNFVNTGISTLKIYTVYTPSNHVNGLIEKTKAEADANIADEAFGNQVR